MPDVSNIALFSKLCRHNVRVNHYQGFSDHTEERSTLFGELFVLNLRSLYFLQSVHALEILLQRFASSARHLQQTVGTTQRGFRK